MTDRWIDFTGLNETFDIPPTLTGAWMDVPDDWVSAGSGEMNAFYGMKHTPETRERMSQAAKNRSEDWKNRQRCANAKKTWMFISPTYSIVWFKGSLKYFCQERGLNTGAMAALHKGVGNRHKGWRRYKGND